MKVKRVLVATDFSPAGQRALDTAAQWARREAAALRIIHVAPTRRSLGDLWGQPARSMAELYRLASQVLRELAERLDPQRELDISTGLHIGRASRCILSAAEEFHADLLVLGTRGEHEQAKERPALGGSAARVAQVTTVPLLLVRRVPKTGAGCVSIAAVNLTSVSRGLVQWALKATPGGTVHVLHCHDVPFVQRLEAYGVAEGAIAVYSQEERTRRLDELSRLSAFAPSDIQVRCAIREGDATAGVLRFAAEVAAELIVIGKHEPRPPGARSSQYGSVCRNLAHFAPTNLLIIPPVRSARSR